MFYFIGFIILVICLYQLRPKNIFYYIELGDFDKLKEYIEKNPESVNNNTHYVTPLSKALWHKDINIIKLLLDNGADPNLLSSDGDAAIHRAYNDLELLKLLEEYGADFNKLTKYKIKYQPDEKPYYKLQHLSPVYLERNQFKIEKILDFYKQHLSKRNINLGIQHWMLDYDALLKNAQKMQTMMSKYHL